MNYETLIARLKVYYPELFTYTDEITALELIESKLIKLSMCDDLTNYEHDKIALLPHIREYLC